MVLNIKVDDKYICHIGVLAKLLMLEHVMISQSLISTLARKYVIDSPEYKDYYQKCDALINTAISRDIKLAENGHNMCLYHVSTQRKKIDDGTDILVRNATTFDDAQQRFFEQVDALNLPGKPKFCGYIRDRKETRSIISYTFALIYKRNPLIEELNFHVNNNIRLNIPLLAWLAILYTCDESQRKGLSLFPTVTIEPIDEQKPTEVDVTSNRTAVLLSGYVRHFSRNKKTHIEFLLNNPNIDVFIHTWTDVGYKNRKCEQHGQIWIDNQSPMTNIDELISVYKPKAYLVEENANFLHTASLVGKLDKIFLHYGQAKDDASRYITSQLYTIKKCFSLMEEYEIENDFKYDVVIKMRFDFNIMKFDYPNILKDSLADIIYFPHAHSSSHSHPGGGGGCLKCDAEGMARKHDAHSNDFCDLWYFGKRSLMEKACTIYYHAENIMKSKHADNISRYLDTNHEEISPFVYIKNPSELENIIVCYYPERLLREHLISEICCSSLHICGELK